MSAAVVTLANPRGFCAGVERAVEIVELALARFGAPVYVKHEVVHNRRIVAGLKARGVVFIEDPNDAPRGAVLIFSAHGVSRQVRAAAAARGLRVFDATCPLVTKVHAEVRRLRAAGFVVVMIGHRGHPEVEGTLGQADDGVFLVETEADIAALPAADNIAFVTQTTLSVDDAAKIVAALSRRYPHIRAPAKDDICYATQNRQDAVKKIAGESDAVFIVGSAESSNANRLREVAESAGARAFLIEDAEAVSPPQLRGVRRIGVSAGASTPEAIVREVVARLRRESPAATVREAEGVREDVVFFAPKELVRAGAARRNVEDAAAGRQTRRRRAPSGKIPDCLIVGGGVIGLTAALALARAGLAVMLLDRDLQGRESSWAGGGVLSTLPPWEAKPAVAALAALGARAFRGEWLAALEEESGVNCECRATGMLVLPPFAADRARAWMDKNGAGREVSPADIAADLGVGGASIWLERVMQVRNPRLLEALRLALGRRGAVLRDKTAMRNWRITNGEVAGLETESGETLRAGRYIVCAGAWSAAMFADAPPPVMPMRGQMLLFARRARSLPCVALRGGFYLIPRADGHLLAGSTVEDAGFDKRVTADGEAEIMRGAVEMLPALAKETPIKRWAGLRPGAPDNIPVIDRHPRFADVYASVGHFRYGVLMAPPSADLLASKIMQTAPPLADAPYRWPAAR